MAKINFAHVPYIFCYGACQPSVASFKLAEGVWVRALESAGKTPYAIAFWAAGEGNTPHPVWVRWEKPKNLPKHGEEGCIKWDGWAGKAYGYAQTEARVLFFGESLPRKMRVTFGWCEDGNGNQVVNGGDWLVEDLGASYNTEDGRTFPIWEETPEWALDRKAVRV